VQVALSDSVFAGLDTRLEELAALRSEREGRLSEMREVLANMWRMLEIVAADENRAFFEKMLVSPARLHAHTLEKARFFSAIGGSPRFVACKGIPTEHSSDSV
jgi:hypothetical protein